MDTKKYTPLPLLCVLLFSLLFSTTFKLIAQEKKSIAIVPVKGSDLAEDENWVFVKNFDDFLQARYNFAYVGTNIVRQYFHTYSIPLESDAEELKNIASDIKVETLLVSKIVLRDGKRALKASLFDVKTGAISKTILEPCDCQPENLASFPFQKVAELLFDAPEIILSGITQKTALLPPPTVIELPTVAAVEDTTKTPEAPDDIPLLPKRIRPRRSRAWKRYAIGAVLIGGGVIYFATRSGSGENGGVSLTILDDPPNPPGSNSR